MVRKVLFCLWLLVATTSQAQTASFTLQGLTTTEKAGASVRLVLENPKARNAEIARTEPDEKGKYEFRNLAERSYRLVAFVDEKRQDRRDVEILCRPGATVLKDFHYGKLEPTLHLHFPAEDPDVVDVAELQGNYSRDVLREYERAKQDHEAGDAERALHRLETVAAKAPGFYGVHARLGLIYQEVGCYEDAEDEYIRASQLSPRSAQPLFNLASVQIRAADLAGQKDKFLARSLETIAKAVEIRPSSPIGHCLAGAAYVKNGAYEEAETSFQRALELDSMMDAARLMLADLYRRRENWAGAVEQFRKFLEDNPLSSDRSLVKEMLAAAEKNL